MQQGYKQTEVGVIPTDWDVCTLEALYNITSSKRVFQSQWRKSGIPFYRAREIAVMSEGKNAPEDLYIDTNLYDLYTRQYGSIKKDDVLITGVGTLGKVYVVKEKDRFYFKDGNIIWLQTKGGFSSQYLKHQYDMPVLINQVFGNAGGSTVATYTITNAKVTKVPVPPLEEQNRIAEALSDVDGMIFSLEKLIAKEKAVKQGAMQELLTGKKRLPGFTGEWKEHILGDLCYLITKQTGFDYTNEIKPSLVDINSNGTLPFIQNKDFCGKIINIQTDYYIPYDVAIKYPRILLDETCLLISLSGRIGNVGLYEKSNGLSFIGGAVGICRFNDEKNAEWCMLYLQSSSGQKQIFECQKSGAQHNLTVEDVRKLVVKLPATLEEQTAIASILSDMDSEIEALEQKLDKTRQIKQGMMQQLLTGKIRLV